MTTRPGVRCWAEVDFDALRQNLAWIRHRVGPRTRVMAVVKADAYGHGLKQIAAVLMRSGANGFGVANLTEADAIRSVGKGWPVLMLGACLPEEWPIAIRDQVDLTLSDLSEAKALSRLALSLGKEARVHAKVDTGMGRLGLAYVEAGRRISEIRRLPGLRLEGVYTHYASVEDDAALSAMQAQRFGAVLDEMKQRAVIVGCVHANNSGGILHQPKTDFDMVRPGLMMYGILPRGRRRVDARLQAQLRPALSFKCRIGLVKEVPRGTPLSYGGSFVSTRRMRVATLTAGYGDGYSRSASNRASVLIRGAACRILGNITMDQMLADVTPVRDAAVGDEVVLIGQQGRREVSAQDLAEACGTIPWEVLTSITCRVPRVYRGAVAA